MSIGRALRVFIADDEPLARRALRKLVERHPNLRVVGEAANGKAALAGIRAREADIVFLDIRMPDKNGIAVADSLVGAGAPYVIFVTAFDEFALRAFEVEAIDYVLKPLDPDRVDTAIARAVAALARDEEARSNGSIQQLLDGLRRTAEVRFPIRDRGRISFVRDAEIDYVEAAADYVRLHCGANGHLVRMTMAEAESRLSGKGFVRIHRSYLVNIDRVAELHPHFNGEYHVLLQGGITLKSSRTYRENMRRSFGDVL